jgi:hypothetical protein
MSAMQPQQDEIAPRFVLITECLQNDLFLNTRCALQLPQTVVPQMLIGRREFDLRKGGNEPNSARAKAIGAGPLGLFLRATVAARETDPKLAVLHVVNLRDWHVAGREYDAERRAYGTHCEGGTWGAQYLDGIAQYLDPTGTADTSDYAELGSARIYHLRTDSLFDFKPRAERRDGQRKFRASELEDVLDLVVEGSDDDLEQMRGLLRDRGLPGIHRLAREVDAEDKPRTGRPVYVAVIGVYTDIKVQTLLVGLRTQYDLPNLAVSDTFTASGSLERHLAALDYSSRVLDVDVVHGINDLAAYVGTPPPLPNEEEVVARQSFARYRSYIQDKQNVLAFQDEKLHQYLALTERRSLEVYERIKNANTFLIAFGAAFLTATLLFSILNAVMPKTFTWKVVAVTGGIGLVQLVASFFSKPMRDLQRNLTNLAVFKMILESHSLKTALARYHLTTPRTLREFTAADEVEAAQAQVGVLRKQVQAIQEFDTADFTGLAELARAIGAAQHGEVAQQAATNGGGTAPSDGAAASVVDGVAGPVVGPGTTAADVQE